MKRSDAYWKVLTNDVAQMTGHHLEMHSPEAMLNYSIPFDFSICVFFFFYLLISGSEGHLALWVICASCVF